MQDSSVQDLRIGKHNLKNELSERTGQLKALVRLRASETRQVLMCVAGAEPATCHLLAGEGEL